MRQPIDGTTAHTDFFHDQLCHHHTEEDHLKGICRGGVHKYVLHHNLKETWEDAWCCLASCACSHHFLFCTHCLAKQLMKLSTSSAGCWCSIRWVTLLYIVWDYVSVMSQTHSVRHWSVLMDTHNRVYAILLPVMTTACHHCSLYFHQSVWNTEGCLDPRLLIRVKVLYFPCCFRLLLLFSFFLLSSNRGQEQNKTSLIFRRIL